MESKNSRRSCLILVAVFSMLACKSPSKPDQAPMASRPTEVAKSPVEDCPELKPYIEKARVCTQNRQAEIMENIIGYCKNPPEGAQIPKICPKDALSAINMIARSVEIANGLKVTRCEIKDIKKEEGDEDSGKHRVSYKLVDNETGEILGGNGAVVDVTETLHEATLGFGIERQVLLGTSSYEEASGMVLVLRHADEPFNIGGKCD